MKILSKISRIVKKAADIFVTVLMFLIVVVIVLQVVSRYVFNSPISWTMEANIFLFAWVIYIGASIVLKEDRHVKIELFLSNFSKLQKRLISIFINSVILILLIILIRNNFVLFPFHTQFRTVSLRIPTSWFNLAFTISCSFMVLFTLEKIVDGLNRIINRGNK